MIINSILLQAQAQSNPIMQLLPLVLIFVVFYFFMIRPQMKRQKELKKYREALTKGDKVITTGGIYGKVLEVSGNVITIEVGNNVALKIDKNAILKDSSDLEEKK